MARRRSSLSTGVGFRVNLPGADAVSNRISFYSVLFRLSTAKVSSFFCEWDRLHEVVSLRVSLAQPSRVSPVTHVFMRGWEPSGMITNPIPALKSDCLQGGDLP